MSENRIGAVIPTQRTRTAGAVVNVRFGGRRSRRRSNLNAASDRTAGGQSHSCAATPPGLLCRLLRRPPTGIRMPLRRSDTADTNHRGWSQENTHPTCVLLFPSCAYARACDGGGAALADRPRPGRRHADALCHRVTASDTAPRPRCYCGVRLVILRRRKTHARQRETHARRMMTRPQQPAHARRRRSGLFSRALGDAGRLTRVLVTRGDSRVVVRGCSREVVIHDTSSCSVRSTRRSALAHERHNHLKWSSGIAGLRITAHG